MASAFDHYSFAIARSPGGRWFDVRLVRSDSGRMWPAVFFGPVQGGLFILAAYGLYRLTMRAWYLVTRRRSWAVIVRPYATAALERVDRSHPVARYELPNRAAAAAKAEAVHRAIESGELRFDNIRLLGGEVVSQDRMDGTV